MTAWYKHGTAAVENGSVTVIGTTTAWLAQAKPGDTFFGPDGRQYEIAAVVGNTELTLATDYQGSTESGAAYAINHTSLDWKTSSLLFAAAADLFARFTHGWINFGVNDTPDASNRLAVASEASRFRPDPEGSGSHVQRILKAAAGNDARTQYESAGTPHARAGLMGNNSYRVMVSPDGMQWFTAIAVDPETGAVSFPNLDGGTIYTIRDVLPSEEDLPATGTAASAYLVAGDLWIWLPDAGEAGEWSNAGPLSPPGPPGDPAILNPRGAYDNGATYDRYDVAADQGSSWICKQDGTTGQPPPTLPTTSNDYWLLNAEKGGAGAGIVDSTLLLEQIATPSPPAAGHNQLYFKDDDKLYKQTSAGVETEVGAGGGGGSPYPPGFIFGLTLSNDTTDATNDLAIAAGACRDKTNAINIDAGAMIKRLDANWAPGTNQGFRYSGAAITNGSYHVYAICKALGADADYYADPSADNATALGHVQAETGGSDYIYARRIGSFKRISGAIWTFIQDGDLVTLSSAVAITTSASAQASTLVDAQVPSGISVGVMVRSFIEIGTSSGAYESLGSAAMGSANLITFGIQGSSQMARGSSVGMVRTNTSAQIYRALTVQSGTVVQYNLNLLGYVDRRGQDGGV